MHNNLTKRHTKNDLSSDSSKINLSESENEKNGKEKNMFAELIEIIIPFFIAGFGMVCAGILFKKVQSWDLYVNVSEIVILVPALLGLKGNLEMTLAARLSTQFNIGKIFNQETKIRATLGNIAMTQLQSIVVGLLASFIACATSLVQEGKANRNDIVILVSSSVCTASIASLLLGTIVIGIIIMAKQYNINPDNIATPIAASLGDAVTLAILSGVGTFFFIFRNNIFIHLFIIFMFILMIPFLIYYCKTNEFVKETLYQGWLPILIAMLISSAAGIILERAIKIYNGLAIYQPVVNGVGGNLVAIYASRLSTVLFQTSTIGTWASWSPKKFYMYPIESFIGKQNPESITALILTSLILPGHFIFLLTIFFVDQMDNNDEKAKSVLTVSFVLFYLFFASLQVLTLLILCYFLVHSMWKLKNNPDNYCIPLLTGFGDLLGVCFLFLCFYIVDLIN